MLLRHFDSIVYNKISVSFINIQFFYFRFNYASAIVTVDNVFHFKVLNIHISVWSSDRSVFKKTGRYNGCRGSTTHTIAIRYTIGTAFSLFAKTVTAAKLIYICIGNYQTKK